MPKPPIEQAGLSDEVELDVRQGAIVIRPAAGPRSGWSEAAADLATTGRELVDALPPTAFEDEWTW